MFAMDAAAATAQYQTVFVPPQNGWLIAAVLVSALLFAVGTLSLLMSVNSKYRLGPTGTRIAIAMGVLGFFGSALLFPAMSPNPHEKQVANMNTDLAQKYNATLAPTDTPADPTPIPADKLTGTNEYQLQFHDGTKGNYFIKWDKDTSEPTIVTGPSAEQLNHSAK